MYHHCMSAIIIVNLIVRSVYGSRLGHVIISFIIISPNCLVILSSIVICVIYLYYWWPWREEIQILILLLRSLWSLEQALCIGSVMLIVKLWTCKLQAYYRNLVSLNIQHDLPTRVEVSHQSSTPQEVKYIKF